MKQHSKVASKLIGKSARNGKKKRKTQDSLRNMRATMKKKNKILESETFFIPIIVACHRERKNDHFFLHPPAWKKSGHMVWVNHQQLSVPHCYLVTLSSIGLSTIKMAMASATKTTTTRYILVLTFFHLASYKTRVEVYQYTEVAPREL